MKERLNKILESKNEQMKNLRTALIDSDSKEERNSINSAIETLSAEISEVNSLIADIDKPANEERKNEVNVMNTIETRNNNTELEYRNAFKNYIANGNVAELRAAAGNSTGSDYVSTVIPANLLTQIVEKIESVGTIYNLVTKTSYPVGQTIPREATKPTATWVGRNTTTLSSSTSGEGNGSSVGKTVLDTTISFTNFKLRCEVALTEEVSRMSLPAFEALFVKNVSIAMLRAIEFAIVDGDGHGMPSGILSNTAPTGQSIEIAAGSSNKINYKTLCEVEAAVPSMYENTAKWCMTKKTFMEIVGITDSNGQPIARINYGITGKPERTILGRDVVIYEPQSGSSLGNYADTVSADTLVGFIFDFGDYVLNNNYDLGIQHKVDWDNEDHRTKAVAAYDGKCIKTDSLVTLKKKH